MCGRYSLTLSAGALAERFDAAVPDDWEPRYNCAPGQTLPVVADDAPDEFRRMTWGYTPPEADETRDLINARSETVDEKRAFAASFESRRCLVPADGFYEWSDRDGRKRPYRVAFEDIALIFSTRPSFQRLEVSWMSPDWTDRGTSQRNWTMTSAPL